MTMTDEEREIMQRKVNYFLYDLLKGIDETPWSMLKALKEVIEEKGVPII